MEIIEKNYTMSTKNAHAIKDIKNKKTENPEKNTHNYLKKDKIIYIFIIC